MALWRHRGAGSALHRIAAPYTRTRLSSSSESRNMPTVLLVKKDPRWSNLKDFVEYARIIPVR